MIKNSKFYFSTFFDPSNSSDPQDDELFETMDISLDKYELENLVKQISKKGASSWTIDGIWEEYEETVNKFIEENQEEEQED